MLVYLIIYRFWIISPGIGVKTKKKLKPPPRYMWFIIVQGPPPKKKQHSNPRFWGVLNHQIVLLVVERGSRMFQFQPRTLLPFAEACDSPAMACGVVLGQIYGFATKNWETSVLSVRSFEIPSRELTYPTLGKGKSSSKCHFWGICEFPGG